MATQETGKIAVLVLRLLVVEAHRVLGEVQVLGVLAMATQVRWVLGAMATPMVVEEEEATMGVEEVRMLALAVDPVMCPQAAL